MAEREIAEVSYRIDKLDPFKQMHIARRLAPILARVATLVPEVSPAPEGETDEDAAAPAPVSEERDFLAALGGMAEALAQMSDADVDYVVKTCLGACSRANAHGTGWSPVVASNGRLMFQDIDLAVMMQLTGAVVQENLTGFFGALGGLSSLAQRTQDSQPA